MSILSRLLKRDEDAPAAGTAAAADVSAAGPLPLAEFPPTAEKTEVNLLAALETSPPPLPSPRANPTSNGAAATDDAFRNLVAQVKAQAGARAPNGQANPAAGPAIETALGDLVFTQLTPLRTLLLELRWGQVPLALLGPARSTVQALRAMSAELALGPLSDALGALDSALEAAVKTGITPVTGAARDSILAAHAPLAARLPRALAIDAEADRRGRVIVESLLGQVPDLGPLLMAKLAAVGLGQLENLVAASAEEITLVAGLPAPIATAVVQKVAEWKKASAASPPQGSGTPADLAAGRRPLELLLSQLDGQHQAFERASSGWSLDDEANKRRARRERERLYLGLRAALARQGEVDFLLWIEKLPYGRRIEELARFLRAPAVAEIPHLPTPRANPTGVGGIADGRAHT